MQHNIKHCTARAACVERARTQGCWGADGPTPEQIDAADRELGVVRDLHDGRELSFAIASRQPER